MRIFSVMGVVVVLGVGVLVAQSCQAGPTVTLGVRVAASQQVPVDKIDHASWSALLQKYVDANGYVNYTAWKASAADQKTLDAYLNHLSAASIRADSSRTAQLAFWINAYNALTLKGILREYPTSSIRNHTAKVFGYNIWKDLHLLVGGKAYSLDAMEHEVLRKMGEPRIHFAIVCASIGCPRLLNEAYTSERLDQQLTVNSQAFFADRSKFVANERAKTVQVSPILDWFGSDFGPNQTAQLRAISPYLPAAAQSLANSGAAKMSFLDYDWGLNDQAKLRK